MSMFAAARCRVRQAFYRLGRRGRTVREPVVEDGPGALYSVPQLVRSGRLGKPLLVIGPDTDPWAERLTQALDESDVPFSTWNGAAVPPTVDDGEALVAYWDSEECESFIALGGPETIDLVKAAAARAASGARSIMDLVGGARVGRRVPPVIAVPTAAGSGAETLCWATLADAEGNRFRLEDPALTPAYAAPDSTLLSDTPRPVVAACVMNGVCLAVEAYLSRYAGDEARAQAASSLRAFLASAEPCWNNGGTVPEREKLLEASRLAGLAASAAGGGYARALSEACAVVSGASFGEACAVLLPVVLEKYGNQAEAELAALASVTGVCDVGPRPERAAALIERLRSLAFRIGLPETIERMEPDMIPEIADLAAATANPRWACPVVWLAEDCERLLRET